MAKGRISRHLPPFQARKPYQTASVVSEEMGHRGRDVLSERSMRFPDREGGAVHSPDITV